MYLEVNLHALPFAVQRRVLRFGRFNVPIRVVDTLIFGRISPPSHRIVLLTVSSQVRESLRSTHCRRRPVQRSYISGSLYPPRCPGVCMWSHGRGNGLLEGLIPYRRHQAATCGVREFCRLYCMELRRVRRENPSRSYLHFDFLSTHEHGSQQLFIPSPIQPTVQDQSL
jgi:hypothetical protein